MPHSSFQKTRIKNPNQHQICEVISARLDIQQQATIEIKKEQRETQYHGILD